jgi:hypothetical protein
MGDLDDNRPFPIQGGTARDANGNVLRPIQRYEPCTIPWWLAEVAYDFYVGKFGHGQSLETLAQRGGFGREELIWYLRRELPRREKVVSEAVKQAQRDRRCRLCRTEAKARRLRDGTLDPFVLDFGREHAHESCLKAEREKPDPCGKCGEESVGSILDGELVWASECQNCGEPLSRGE